MRFRVKHLGHTKHPPHGCQFMAVLKQSKPATISKFNLEENTNQVFPKILNSES
jgi:hypothetical protein